MGRENTSDSDDYPTHNSISANLEWKYSQTCSQNTARDSTTNVGAMESIGGASNLGSVSFHSARHQTLASDARTNDMRSWQSLQSLMAEGRL